MKKRPACAGRSILHRGPGSVDQLTLTALQAEATPLYCAEPEP
jgi:hypothetical protein